MPIAHNQLPLDRDRYDAFRLACHRWRDELTQWQAELQAALPTGEPLAEREHDAAVNAVESLGEAIESVSAAYQWATGLVSEVKVKELT